MPRIVAGVPLIVTPEGLKERLDAPADTETRLYWEMQLDRGDAILEPLTRDMYPDGSFSVAAFTHRLISETGGSFHVRVEEGERIWPVVSTPTAFLPLVGAVEAMERMKRQIVTLLAANQELEQRVKELEEGLRLWETGE